MKLQDPNTEHEYIVKADRASPEPTVFLVRFQNYKDRIKFIDSVKHGGSEGVSIKAGTRERDLIKSHLLGWRNLFDSEGSAVEFKTDPSRRENGRECISDDAMNWLPPKVLSEIAGYIAERSTLDEDERKN